MVKIPGPTGTYPQGKLKGSDRGAVGIKLEVVNGKLVLDFGTELTWFAMDRATAMALALVLKRFIEEGK